MKLEKVFFETEDGIELCGLLHEPEEKSKEIVIAVHGMQSNCLKKRDDYIAKKITNENISYFCFNNRGHDLISSFSKNTDGKKQKILLGTCLEDIKDSYFDIKAAVKTMIDLGYTKIHLQGHSLGCTKIVYTYNKMKENNDTEFLDKINSVILLSMVDLANALRFFFNSDKDELVEKMEFEVKKGNGNTIFTFPGAIIPMSPNTLLRYMKNNEKIDFARFSDENYDFKELNEIKVPIFMRWGNNNELILQPADKLVEFLNNKIQNDKKDLGFIDGATHNYSGKEQVLADDILKFLKKVTICS